MRRPDWPADAAAQTAEVLTRVERTLEDKGFVAYLRFVALQRDTGWHALFSRIDICRDGELRLGPRYKYRRVRTLAEKVGGADFLERLREALNGKKPFSCEAVPLLGLAPPHPWMAESHSSDSDYAPWPCHYFERQLEQTAAVGIDGPYVSGRRQPYFENLTELIGQISGFRTFHGYADARKSMLNLFLWNYAGRFGAVVPSGRNDISVTLEGRALKHLKVVGRYVGTKGRQQTRELASTTVVISAPREWHRIQLALVGRTDEPVDEFTADIETLAPPPTQAQNLLAAFARQIQLGESAQVEFKPFVRLAQGEQKWEEVLKTAIAMANTRGGHIFIGIDNHGAPVFGPDDLRILLKESGLEIPPGSTHKQRHDILRKAALTYGSALRDRIQTLVRNSLHISRFVFWLRDMGPILALSVRRGDERPYMDGRDNSVWFRTNATNRRPLQAELATILGNGVVDDLEP